MIKRSVFLDTSFLIASQINKHEFFERTKDLRKTFLLEKYNLYSSPLVFDEFWYVLLGILKDQLGSDTSLIYRLIQQASKNILSIEGLSLLDLDLKEKELLDVLNIMQTFKLRPRDAMIIKIMKKAKIKHIASFDKDFDKVRGISRIY